MYIVLYIYENCRDGCLVVAYLAGAAATVL